MKFEITVDGDPRIEVTLNMDTPTTFTGTIESSRYGTGQITAGTRIGNDLKGTVSLDGYEADFSATISSTGTTITGALKYGWFFNKKFVGVQIT